MLLSRVIKWHRYLCYSSSCVIESCIKVALVLVLLTGVLSGTHIVSIVVYKSLLRYRHNVEVKTIVKTSYIVYT